MGNTQQRKVNQIPSLWLSNVLLCCVVFFVCVVLPGITTTTFPRNETDVEYSPNLFDTRTIFRPHHYMILACQGKHFEKNMIYGKRSQVLLLDCSYGSESLFYKYNLEDLWHTHPHWNYLSFLCPSTQIHSIQLFTMWKVERYFYISSTHYRSSSLYHL